MTGERLWGFVPRSANAGLSITADRVKLSRTVGQIIQRSTVSTGDTHSVVSHGSCEMDDGSSQGNGITISGRYDHITSSTFERSVPGVISKTDAVDEKTKTDNEKK